MGWMLGQILLAVFGIGLCVVAPERIGFLPGSDQAVVAACWFRSFQLFVVPLCLLALRVWGRWIFWLSALWTGWLSVCAVRMGISVTDWYGDWTSGVAVAFSGVLALSPLMASLRRLSGR